MFNDNENDGPINFRAAGVPSESAIADHHLLIPVDHGGGALGVRLGDDRDAPPPLWQVVECENVRGIYKAAILPKGSRFLLWGIRRGWMLPIGPGGVILGTEAEREAAGRSLRWIPSPWSGGYLPGARARVQIAGIAMWGGPGGEGGGVPAVISVGGIGASPLYQSAIREIRKPIDLGGVSHRGMHPIAFHVERTRTRSGDGPMGWSVIAKTCDPGPASWLRGALRLGADWQLSGGAAWATAWDGADTDRPGAPVAPLADTDAIPF